MYRFTKKTKNTKIGYFIINERFFYVTGHEKKYSSDEGSMSPEDTSPCPSPLTGSGPETTVVEPFTVSSYDDLCKVLESIK